MAAEPAGSYSGEQISPFPVHKGESVEEAHRYTAEICISSSNKKKRAMMEGHKGSLYRRTLAWSAKSEYPQPLYIFPVLLDISRHGDHRSVMGGPEL
jgi:hypothetical protein